MSGGGIPKTVEQVRGGLNFDCKPWFTLLVALPMKRDPQTTELESPVPVVRSRGHFSRLVFWLCYLVFSFVGIALLLPLSRGGFEVFVAGGYILSTVTAFIVRRGFYAVPLLWALAFAMFGAVMSFASAFLIPWLLPL
jgi:hypothetical protein